LTIFLDANFIQWKKEFPFKTSLLAAPSAVDFDMNMLPGVFASPFNNLNSMTQLAADAIVVGLIVHTTFNNATGETTWTVLKGTSDQGVSNPVITETLIKVSIPAGQAGFFFSDPTIAEASRQYLKDDYVGIRQRQIGGQFLAGMRQVTVMMAFEIETT